MAEKWGGKMSRSKIMAALPPECTEFYTKNQWFIRVLVNIGVATQDDIVSDVFILHAANDLTFGALAKIYNVRKLNGVWVATDPICGHAESLNQLGEQGFDVIDERLEYSEESQPELPAGVVVSTRELSRKLHVTMRRAQQIYAAKVADLAAGNDLFGLGVSHG
jgi:hypothetical protein